MNSEETLHAKLSNEAYNKHRKRNIDGYKYLDNLSDNKLAVYRHPHKKHTITTIRGTRINDMRDLFDDYNIIKGSTRTPYFENDQQRFRKIKQRFKNDKHTITGHSRGGVSARNIARNNKDIQAYTYNEAFSPKNVWDLIRNNKKQKNVRAIRTKRDLVSLLNPNINRTINDKGFRNAHGINNFIR